MQILPGSSSEAALINASVRFCNRKFWNIARGRQRRLAGRSGSADSSTRARIAAWPPHRGRGLLLRARQVGVLDDLGPAHGFRLHELLELLQRLIAERDHAERFQRR